MDSKCKLNTENGKPLEDISQFQRLVGKLIYLTVIRSDISYSISQITKFIHSPRILRYLKSTSRLRFHFKTNNSNEICGYSDVDWVECFDRKLTTGFYTFVCRNIVKWRSKKNKISWLIQAPEPNTELWHQSRVN
jgi:hypothetical protein